MANRDSLKEIEQRHTRDRWRDGLFIGLAVLVVALAIGMTTRKLAGKNHVPEGTVQVESGPVEIMR
jgi:hypothetical protein